MALIKLLGSAPNQVSTNRNFGTMAWQDASGVQIAGGTATLTSLTVNGTAIPTNGVYLPSANSLGLSANTSLALFVSNAGNVGIKTGTATNINSLSVLASSAGQGIDLYYNGGAAARWAIVNPGVNNTVYVGSVINNDFALWANSAERMRIFTTGGVSIGNTTDRGAGNLNLSGVVITGGYTVATLPTGVVGMRAYVTNALAPSYGATVVGGGVVTIPVFYNGTNWICA